jgi:UDP-N-acetylmuramoyl-tripeptide--D-alanyl-D-alanine ligase
MFELGKQSGPRHLQLGRRVSEARLDRLCLLGPQSAQVRKGALQGGMPSERILIGKDHRDIARQLRSCVRRGDWLLFKGSRGMQMERVLKELKG